MGTKEYMEKFKNKLQWKPGESIMEFGIGCGVNTIEGLLPNIPYRYKEFIGSDISLEMVWHASRNLQRHRRIQIVQLDIACETTPPEFEERFDHIFAFMVLHWVENIRKAFINIKNMLKPGGEFFLTFCEKIATSDIFFELKTHPRWGKYGHEEFITPFYPCDTMEEQFKKAIRESGIVDFEIELQDRTFQFHSEQDFTAFACGINPVIGKIPIDEVDEYRKTYLAMMKESSFNWVAKCERTGEEVFHSHYKVFVVLGRRPKKCLIQ